MEFISIKQKLVKSNDEEDIDDLIDTLMQLRNKLTDINSNNDVINTIENEFPDDIINIMVKYTKNCGNNDANNNKNNYNNNNEKEKKKKKKIVLIIAIAAGLLWEICWRNRNIVPVGTTDVILLLLQWLKNHDDNDNEEMEFNAVAALWILSRDSQNKRLIGENGGIQLLMDIIARTSASPKLKTNAITTLKNIATFDRNKLIIHENNGVAFFLEMIKNYENNEMNTSNENEDDDNIIGMVAATFRNLSVNNDLAQVIFAKGGLPSLVYLLNSPKTSLRTKSRAAAALANFSSNNTHVEQIIEIGGLQKIIFLLLELFENDGNNTSNDNNNSLTNETKDNFLVAVDNLSCNDLICDAIANFPGSAAIECLLRLISNWIGNAKNERFQYHAISALWGFAFSVRSRNIIIEYGGVNALMKLLSVDGKPNGFLKEDTKIAIAGTICNIAMDDDCAKIMFSDGAIPMLLDLIKSDVTVSGVSAESSESAEKEKLLIRSKQNYVVSAIRNIATFIEAKEDLYESGGISIIIDLLRESINFFNNNNLNNEKEMEDYQDLKAVCVNVLNNVCNVERVKENICELDVIPLLIDVLKYENEKIEVKVDAVSAIRGFCFQKEKNKEETRKRGGIIELLRALNDKKDNNYSADLINFKYKVVSTLFTLCENPHGITINSVDVVENSGVPSLVNFYNLLHNLGNNINYNHGMASDVTVLLLTVLGKDDSRFVEELILCNGIPKLASPSNIADSRRILSLVTMEKARIFFSKHKYLLSPCQWLNKLYQFSSCVSLHHLQLVHPFPMVDNVNFDNLWQWRYHSLLTSNESCNVDFYNIQLEVGNNENNDDINNNNDDNKNISERAMNCVINNDVDNLRILLLNKFRNNDVSVTSIGNLLMCKVSATKIIGNYEDDDKSCGISLECTPLYIAVARNNYECSQLLLKYRCNSEWVPKVSDSSKLLPMICIACLNGNIPMLSLLLTLGECCSIGMEHIRMCQSALALQNIPIPGAIAHPFSHSLQSRNLSHLHLRSIQEIGSFSSLSWQNVTKLDLSYNDISG